jgi:Lrp/AsnC family transcriptional regulator for asnA, asnC and gidA
VESRTSFTELAKICGISVTAVQRRFNRLIKSGIICRENMYLNPIAVGYKSIAELGIITNLVDRKKVLDSLRNVPRLQVFDVMIGKYTISGLVRAKTLDDLNETVRMIDIKPLVKSVDLLIYADLWINTWHPENLMVNLSERKNLTKKMKKFDTKFKPVSLDEMDKSIARMLMEKSRTPFSTMAKNLKISTNTVIQRYKFLREKNVLNLSTISVDLKKLGYKAILDTFIKVKKRGKLLETETQLLNIPNSIFLAKFVSGAYDLRTATIVADFQDVFWIKSQIYSMENIKTAEFYLNDLVGPWPTEVIGQTLLD